MCAICQIVDPHHGVLKSGQVYDSNRSTLLAALKEQGFPARDLGIVPDRWVEQRTLKMYNELFL